MGQILHGSATTTEAVRRAIQHSQESLRGLAKRYGVNPKTVAKVESAVLRFRPADRTQAAQIDGPVSRGRRGRRRCIRQACPAAARRLPVRSAAHHRASGALVHFTGVCNACGISRLPQVEGEASAKRRIQGLSNRLLSYRHRRGFRTAPRQALRSTSPSTRSVEVLLVVGCVEKVARRTARTSHAPPDRRRRSPGPCRPHRQRNPLPPGQYELGPGHQGRYGGRRARLGARLRGRLRPGPSIAADRPGIHGPMGKSKNEPHARSGRDCRRYFYETHDQLQTHLQNFVDATNFARRLKALGGLTPSRCLPKRGRTSHGFKLSIAPPRARD